MAQLNPYLLFRGNCRDAMEFYKEALGGELTMQTVGESAMAGQVPAEGHNNIMHSKLVTKDGFTIMGSDMLDEDEKNGNRISLCLICKSEEEIENLFSKISAGGNVAHPLAETFFGTFGDFVDKFGINWMMELDKPKAE